MRLFADFRNEKNKNFSHIELSYSCLFIIGGPKWFCRLTRKDWVHRLREDGESWGWSYGKNKFEAYRNAIKNLTHP